MAAENSLRRRDSLRTVEFGVRFVADSNSAVNPSILPVGPPTCPISYFFRINLLTFREFLRLTNQEQSRCVVQGFRDAGDSIEPAKKQGWNESN